MINILSNEEYNNLPIYDGNDLGANYSKEKTLFKLWAPTADSVKVCLYKNGDGDLAFSKTPCTLEGFGVWSAEVKEDLLGVYFTYEVEVGGVLNEAVDPYAKAVGVNGKRGMVVDLSLTDIEGWNDDNRVVPEEQTDAIIYEVHVRDMTINENSGAINKGKFLGMVEEGTKTKNGVKTGIDHLKELGVTHVQLLPIYDYFTVDESRLNEPQFNWGYDPLNYNAPEGSYSTDPFDGMVRIKELKRMIKGFHNNGLGVIMDVVYNHTGHTQESYFNKIVHGYYYRQSSDGNFSDASACGNETASERAMVRKFIIDSVVYWAKEYHIDGFRFDLMAIHDLHTMNEIRKALDEIDPRITIHGEGWNGGATPLKEELCTYKRNMYKLNSRIAAFSDDIRDGVKGDVFIEDIPGFVNGGKGMEESVKFGVIASTSHPQIDYSKVNYSKEPWANAPTQTVTYVSAHDNLTLWDKLLATCKDEAEENLIKMNKLSAGIVLTSQGISFIHAGEEFLRTKGGDHNSFKSPDSVNMLDWDRKEKYMDVFNYYKGLIELRKSHPAFRMRTTEDIAKNLKFFEVEKDNVVAFHIGNNANGDNWKDILVIYNGNKEGVEIELPEGVWNMVANGEIAGIETIKEVEKKIFIEPISMVVLRK